MIRATVCPVTGRQLWATVYAKGSSGRAPLHAPEQDQVNVKMASGWSQRYKDNKVAEETLRQEAEADVSTRESKRRKRVSEELIQIADDVADARSKLDALAASMHAHHRSKVANDAAQQVLAMLEDPRGR